MNFNISSQAQYTAKRMTAEQAVQQVRNGDFIIVPTGAGEPPTLLTALSEARRQFKDVKVGSVLPMRKFAYLDPETYDNIRHVGFFLGD
jgi:acyl-CoA hydrolase